MLGPERLGCFQIPSEKIEPQSGLDIPECRTLEKQDVKINTRSFIMGHRLQFKASI